jgi:ketosteroid isomerase-like protein
VWIDDRAAETSPGRPEYPVDVAVDAVRAAYQSLGEGDVEPLVLLMHSEMEWRGRRKLLHPWASPS